MQNNGFRKHLKMLQMKRLAVMVMAVMPFCAFAQDDVEATVSADIVSRYMWRGQDRGGFSVQPSGGVYWKGLSLTAFGNAGLDSSDPHEINLTLGYQNSGFNIGVTDYWATGIDPEDRYFFYDEKNTGHQLEANLGYTCKYFTLQGYTIFWGNDFKKDGKRAYSTFVEAGVPFKLGGIDWMVRAGITPMESAGHYEERTIYSQYYGTTQVYVPVYDYAEGFACNMASIRATKNLFVGDVRLPIFAELHTNPYLQTARLVFGVSVIPF